MVEQSAIESAGEPRPRKPRRRWLGSLVAIVLLVAIAALAWHLTHRAPAAGARGPGRPGAGGGGGPGGPGGPFGGGGGGPATTVGVARAERADVPVVLEALGTVTPVATVTVRPQVSGVITQVAYTEGQMVAKGQLLALIDPRPFEMAVLQSEGQLQRDQAQLEAARVTAKRYETLLSQDSIARQDVDTQVALVKQLDAALVTDRATLGNSRLNLSYTRIVSPVAGRVGLRVVDAGNYISAGDSGGVAVVTQINPIDVQFAVPQDSVPEVSRQAAASPLKVTALDRSRTTTLDTGTFSTLDNRIDATTGTVKAKARFMNASGTLFPSQFVNVRLLVRTLVGVTVVPTSAVRHGSTGDFVYLLNADQTVSIRNVTRGEATTDKVVMTSGLDVGDRVITEGGDRLREGSKVMLPGQAASAASGAGRGRRAASGAAGSEGRHASGAEGTERHAFGAASGAASGASAVWSGRRHASDASN